MLAGPSGAEGELSGEEVVVVAGVAWVAPSWVTFAGC